MIPLTFAQERLWLFEQIESSAAYNLTFGLRLRGRLDLPALRRTFDAIVARHEILRTTFPSEDGSPHQVIGDPAPVELPVLDLTGLPAPEREQRLAGLTAAEATTPFDLAAGPLLRVRLYRLAADSYVLLLVTHHIVSDGWSQARLISEVEALYPAFARGEDSPLPELPVQYADYALWQREVLSGAALAEQVGFWRRALEGVPALELPTARPRPQEQTFQGGDHWFPIPERIGARFLALARAERATPFMALLAAFQFLLSRYTGQRDVAVGTPIAGRTRPELYDLIGFFVNTLVLRGDLSGDPSFRQLLAGTRARVLDAYAHQDVPLQQVASELSFVRDLSRNALFQVVFAYQDVPAGQPRLPGLEVSDYSPDVTMNLADLQLNVYPTEVGLLGHLIYNRDLFDESWMEGVAEHLTVLLERVVAAPDTPLSQLSLLPAGQWRRIVREWSAGPEPVSIDPLGEPSSEPAGGTGGTVVERFNARVRHSPDAVALRGAGTESGAVPDLLTYAQLDHAASRVARQLRRHQIGSGAVVGVCAGRGTPLVAALLGVWKAGAAYLPLDPAYPRSRLRFMAEDSGVRVVLAGAGCADRAQWGDRVTVLDLDSLVVPDPADHRSDTEPCPEAGPHDLAYVIYTSGSTGVPKGVAVPHAALAARVDWMRRAYRLGPGDRVLQFASVSFDTHGEEIYPCLTAGATLVVPDPEVSVPEVLRTPAGQELTVLDLPTPYWHELVRAVRERTLRFPDSLRLTIIGADQASADAVATWQELVGGRLVNTYGPTEATIVATAAELTPEPSGFTVPIGSPIDRTQVYVLDEAMHPVPVGVSGELYLGGVGLAWGYLGRAGLTAQRFVPDPFGASPGGRLYRTGDLARFRPDGVLEFVGRTDAQVKVRGYRVEPGEVEEALAGHPWVDQVVVSARDDDARGKRLVAYLVARGDSEAAAAVSEPEDSGAALPEPELRAYLARRLPAYLVPSAFVRLDRLPLTANGKVDRAALPAPTAGTAAGGYRAPQTPAQRVLAQIWQELLGVERVGLDDNFFTLGGDSIISIQVVARARARGVLITPRQMFRHQSVLELAAAAQVSTEGNSPVAGPEGTDPVSGPVPFTSMQLWLLDRQWDNLHHLNQSMLGAVPPDTDPRLLERALRAVVTHHDALRLRLRRDEGRWRQDAMPAGEPVTVAEVDLTELAPPARTAALTTHATALQSSLDLERGPLLRCALYTVHPEEPKRFFLTIHHWAVDAVSWQILREDIARAYQQLCRGEQPALPARTSSVRTYGEWLHRYADSPELDAERPYWHGVREGAPAGVPVDHETGPNSLDSVDVVTVALTERQTEVLSRELPARHRAQVVDAVLAALAEAVAEWTGRPELLVDLEGHGRELPEPGIDLSRTVGWFTALYPVRLSAGGDLESTVERVARARAEVPRGGIGYGALRHLSTRDRGLRDLPAPAVSVNYLGRFDQDLDRSAFFAPAEADTGPDLAATGHRAYLLEVNGGVFGGRLELTFAYSHNRHRRETVERLAETVLARLGELSLGKIERYPLTPVQHGLLFETMRNPHRSVYLIQLELLLHGDLDLDALGHAWQLLTRRHEVLRTAVPESLEEPCQEVHPEVTLPVTVHDWRHLDSAARQQRREEFLAADRAAGFDLGTPPLARVALIRQDDSTTRMVMTHHHLLLDGWGSARLLEELFAGYEAIRAGRAPRLAPVRPYRDYLDWLRHRTEAGEGAGNGPDEAYWRAQLAGFTAPTPLAARPASGPISGAEAEAARDGDEYILELSVAQTAQLVEFCRRHRLTLSTLVQGAWALVLGRNTGETDVVFGVTLAGRPPDLPGVESMVGLFINTLPLRVRIADQGGDHTVVEWLRGLQEQVTEVREHEHSGLVDVQGWSQVPRGTALFDSIVVFENYPTGQTDPASRAGLRVEQVRVREQTSYPLTIAAVAGDRLLLRFSFQPDRLGRTWVERTAAQMVAALERAATDPAPPVSAVPMLPPQQRHQVLAEWNDTEADYGPPTTLAEWFSGQVSRTPQAVAVRYADRQLTYSQLAAAADRVAHRLRGLGVGPGAVVGVCAERGIELVVGLLGTLAAGAAYLPLDPTYPARRLEYMLADSGAPVLLTGPGSAVELVAPDGVQRLPIAEAIEPGAEAGEAGEPGAGARQEGESGAGPDSMAGPEDLAYVIYTSGSTGAPKGVMVSHAAIVNRLRWMQDTYRLTGDDRVLQKTPSSFDVSVWEFFWPLLTGATLVLAAPDGHRDPAYLRDLIATERITTLHFVPSMLRAFLDQDGLERCVSLRRVICSGEELPAPLAADVFAQLHPANPELELHNLYGPTEAAVDVTWWRCRPGQAGPVPIGRPIGNTQVYLLDSDLNPVPMGAPGEVYLGGAGLARGYLGRPGLTARRFVPDPFGARPGARLYRTGDLARHRDDGSIEFVGRVDHQVKLRGFRIELGEIEATLAANPQVAQAVVVARDEPATGRRLVAYLVPAGQVPDPEALRSHLSGSLPEYMVPSAFVTLPALPLTPSGKVDRRALPAPEPPAAGPRPYRTPDTPVARVLAQVWQELLGVDRVGMDDSFFTLGGHSLLAMRVVAKASKLLPPGTRTLRVMDLFAHRTLGALAEHLAGDREAEGPARLLHELTPPVPAEARQATLVCAPYGGGSAVVFQPLADALPAGYGLLAIGLPGHDPGDPEETPESIDALARRCADELEPVSGPLILYGHCLGGGALTIALAQELESRGREVTAAYIGGSFPSTRLPGRVSRLLGRFLKTGALVGDRTYYHMLKGMGGFRGGFSDAELAQIMAMLRHDVREAEEFYARAYAEPPRGTLRAPVISVVAEHDPTTELHQERYLEWRHFAESVALVVLPGSDHYFLNSQAEPLASILTTVHTRAEQPPPVRAKVLRPAPEGGAGDLPEPSTLSSLRVFALVAGSQLVSLVGAGLTGFALGLWVYLNTGSLTQFALVEMFAILPGVLAAPLAGAIVDRSSRRRVMLVANLVGLAVQLLMAVLVWQDALPVWLIVVLLSVLSVAGGFHGIAYLSAIPQLAPKRFLIRMNGMVQVSLGLAEMVAPLLAVGLLAWVGIGAVLLVDAATYALAAVVLMLVTFPRTLPLQRLESLRDEIVYGFRYLIRTPGLRWLLTYFSVLSILTAPLFLLIIPLVLPFGSIGVIGWLFFGAGMGVLVGGLLMTMWGGPRRLMAGVLGSSISGGLSVIAIGTHPSLAMVGFGLFGWVLSAAVFQACYASIVQLKVPLALQGRVFAVVQMVSLGVAPVAYLATGPLGDHVFEPMLAGDGALAGTVGQAIGTGEGRGIALMYVLAGIGILIATVAAYRSRAIWHLEDDLADALPDEPVAGAAGLPPPPSRYFDEPALEVTTQESEQHDPALAARP